MIAPLYLLAFVLFALVLHSGASASGRQVEPITPVPVQPPQVDPRKVELGRLLFADGRLSQRGRTSCASCHDIATNGASAARFDRGNSGQALQRNTPTVFNASLSFRLNWDGRFRSMPALLMGIFHNGELMGGSGGITVARMRRDPDTVARFRALYGRLPDEAGIADALAAFMRTLVTPNAPFDRWLRGDRSALGPQQVRGYARFKALGCASCHQGVNVGANLYQKRGVYFPLGRKGPETLRVPSLRNVAVTPPYFYDGSAATLPEVIRQMGRAQLGLALNREEVADIVAFLQSLTGDYRGRPLKSARPADGRR